MFFLSLSAVPYTHLQSGHFQNIFSIALTAARCTSDNLRKTDDCCCQIRLECEVHGEKNVSIFLSYITATDFFKYKLI